MTTTTETAPAAETLASLRAATQGLVLEPGDAAFDALTAGYERSHPHRPAVIVAVETAADIAAAVRFARARGLSVAVLATGHGPVRTTDGGVLIHLGRMNAVTVNAAERTVTVGPAATWADVQRAAVPLGLAGVAGDSPSVGVVGYTLGGGFGRFARRHGLGADNLVEVELVTADGEMRTVNASSDPELFWALRGGGGGFGVVASMTLRLHEHARVFAGVVAFPEERAAEALRFYREWVKDLPDATTSVANLLRGPDLDVMPPFVRGRLALVVQFYHSGPEDEGRRVAAPLLAFPGSVAAQALVLGADELGRLGGPPEGPLVALGRGEHLAAITDAFIDALVSYARELRVPNSLEVRHLGGVVDRVPVGETAFANRGAAFLLNARVLVPFPQARPAAEAFVRDVTVLAAPFATGRVMPNFLMGDEGEARDRAAYHGEVFARLERVKARVDPDRVFRYARTPGSR